MVGIERFLNTALIVAGCAFVIGIYDGFYGPGTGTFLLLLLTGLARMGLEKAQGVSKAINFSTNIASVTVYLINRSAVIPLGLAAGVFSIAGNLLGSRVFISGGAKSVRPVMLTVIGIFIIKVILELFGVI